MILSHNYGDLARLPPDISALTAVNDDLDRIATLVGGRFSLCTRKVTYPVVFFPAADNWQHCYYRRPTGERVNHGMLGTLVIVFQLSCGRHVRI